MAEGVGREQDVVLEEDVVDTHDPLFTQARVRDERIAGRSSDSGLLNLIANREQWDRTLQWDESLDAKLQSLTLEQVNAAFRKYVDPEAVSIVKGGDFARVKSYP